jgi:hypothetical protein
MTISRLNVPLVFGSILATGIAAARDEVFLSLGRPMGFLAGFSRGGVPLRPL